MKLEEEIKQKSFRNESHKLAVNLMYTHGWFINTQSDLFKKYDLTTAQFNILRILRGQYPNQASINLLKDRMLDKMSDVSRLVERLRTKGLIERKICEQDRRRAEVIITNKGLELLKELDELEYKFDSIFRNLNEDEAKNLNNLLDKLRG